MKTLWERHFLVLESAVAVAISGAFGLWQATHDGGKWIDDLISGNRGAIYGALSAIFGALLGFAITAASITLGYGEDPRMTRVRQGNSYRQLGNVFRLVMPVLAIATLAALACLLADKDNSPNTIVRDVLVLGILLSATSLGRLIWVFDNVIRIVTRPSLARSGDDP